VFSDAAGEATLPEARGLPLRLQWRRSGRGPGVMQVERAPRQIELVMPEAVSLIGEIHGRDGALADAAITLMAPTGAHRERSDEQGRFSFADLAPSSAQLLVLADGYVPEQRDVAIVAEPDRPMDLGRIELTEGGSVRGIVVDEVDEPVAGARVALGRVPTYLPLGALPPGIVLTRRDGGFILPDLPAGKQPIEALLIGFGRDTVDVTIRPGEQIEDVRIVLHEDAADAGGDMEGAGSLAVTLSEENGGIVFDHVPLNGEAQRAGIRPGDGLLRFNGVPVTTLGRTRRLLTGPLSEDFVLELSRPPDLRWSVRVKRERLRR
jgi:hypothetical protein